VTDSEYNKRSLGAAFAASVGMFVGTTPMVSAVTSLFVVPISSEFGISRASYSALMLVSPYIVALCAPFGGRLLDRFGTRRVILPIVLMFGLTQLAMWQASALWQVIALFALTGVAGGVHTYTAYTRVISTWFASQRGLILGLMLAMGSSLGSVLIPQLVRYLNERYGWRAGYVGMGCVILFYGLPIMCLYLYEPVRATGAKLRDAGLRVAALDGCTVREALRSRSFWTICLALFLAPMAIIGTIGHSVPMLTERGFTSVMATNALSSVYLGAMAGQLSSGWLLDRFDTPRIVLPFFFLGFIGMLIMHSSDNAVSLLPGAILMGFTQGTEMGIGSYLVTRYCGLKSFGAIYSIVFGAANLGLGVGILGMGRVHDLAGSYAPMAFVLPGVLLVSMLLLFSLGPYAFAKQNAVSEADRLR
jgi:MFS family permease